MGVSLERGVAEAGSVLALTLATAALHYTYGFHTPFGFLAAKAAAAAQASPVLNYVGLLAAAAMAYLVARGACIAAVAATPERVKSSKGAWRALWAVAVPATARVAYFLAGSQGVFHHPLWLWLERNLNRNAKRDAGWCARLFVLLLVWQAVLGLAVASCAAVGSRAWRLARHAVGHLRPGRRDSDKRRPAKEAAHQAPQPDNGNGASHSGDGNAEQNGSVKAHHGTGPDTSKRPPDREEPAKEGKLPSPETMVS